MTSGHADVGKPQFHRHRRRRSLAPYGDDRRGEDLPRRVLLALGDPAAVRIGYGGADASWSCWARSSFRQRRRCSACFPARPRTFASPARRRVCPSSGSSSRSRRGSARSKRKPAGERSGDQRRVGARKAAGGSRAWEARRVRRGSLACRTGAVRELGRVGVQWLLGLRAGDRRSAHRGSTVRHREVARLSVGRRAAARRAGPFAGGYRQRRARSVDLGLAARA
jgi:hypothetical protein